MNHAGKDFEQQVVGAAAALGDFRGQIFALGRLHQVDLVQRQALTLGEADGCASGRAGGIVGDGLRRARDFIFDVGLFGDAGRARRR